MYEVRSKAGDSDQYNKNSKLNSANNTKDLKCVKVNELNPQF